MDADAAVRVELYRQFVETCRPPTPTEVGEPLGLAEDEAAAVFRRLAEQHVIVLRPGTLELWMAAPLSAVETPFRIETPRGSYFGNCAWDALGVLAMLDTDGTVSTGCPDCAEPLELRVSDGELEAEGVAHFLVPAAHWWDDIGHT